MTIKAAADEAGLGASTARMILRKYQKTGTFFEPKIVKKSTEKSEKNDEQNEQKFQK